MRFPRALPYLMQLASEHETWWLIATLARPGRSTAFAVLAALTLSLMLFGLSASGNLDAFPNFAKPLVLPGISCLYVVGTITNSVLWSVSAFGVVMIIVYGGSPLADMLVRYWIRRRPASESIHRREGLRP